MSDTPNPPSDQQFWTEDDFREEWAYWLAERESKVAALLKDIKEACRRFALEQRGTRGSHCFGNLWWEVHQLFHMRTPWARDYGTEEPEEFPLVCEIARLIDMSGVAFNTYKLEGMVHAVVKEVEAELWPQQA
jgi:hypothetical protein